MEHEPGRREQILDAAFEEFSDKGLAGATIKSIAQRAALKSPALIYWYFPEGKQELFYAAAEAKITFLGVFKDPEPLMEAPPELALPTIASAYLTFAADPTARRLFRLLLAEAPRHPGLLEPVVARGPLRVLGFLSAYLERQVELGRLRPHDTRAGARAFIGMLIPQALSHVLMPQLQVDGPTDAEHMRTAIGIFLDGLKPDGREAGGDSHDSH
ncbi:MAG TPA: TetR/AcrR family transcriptional regulator [Thermomicrobiales bacterium]|nr:TetR/AcrR family transcriptional regulator [Thermomicrobiales bacterium]